MKITDVISITELSRLLNKSRPTVYKYISDFENGSEGNVPHSVRRLFHQIQSGNIPKRGIYEYCDHWFASEGVSNVEKAKRPTLKEIIRLLKENERKLDLDKIKNFIDEEIRK